MKLTTAKIAESFGAKVVYYSTSGNHIDEYYKKKTITPERIKYYKEEIIYYSY